MPRRVVETYFDETLAMWTNRLKGGDEPVGSAFPSKVEAVSRGADLAIYLGVSQVVLSARHQWSGTQREGSGIPP